MDEIIFDFKNMCCSQFLTTEYPHKSEYRNNLHNIALYLVEDYYCFFCIVDVLFAHIHSFFEQFYIQKYSEIDIFSTHQSLEF